MGCGGYAFVSIGWWRVVVDIFWLVMSCGRYILAG